MCCLIVTLSGEDSWVEAYKILLIKDQIHRLNWASKHNIKELIVEAKLC